MNLTFSENPLFSLKVRPPGIYKQDYLLELFTRYGDAEDTPSAPPLPEWCSESDDGDRDDDGNAIEEVENGTDEQKTKRRRIEEIKMVRYAVHVIISLWCERS